MTQPSRSERKTLNPMNHVATYTDLPIDLVLEHVIPKLLLVSQQKALLQADPTLMPHYNPETTERGKLLQQKTNAETSFKSRFGEDFPNLGTIENYTSFEQPEVQIILSCYANDHKLLKELLKQGVGNPAALGNAAIEDACRMNNEECLILLLKDRRASAYFCLEEAIKHGASTIIPVLLKDETVMAKYSNDLRRSKRLLRAVFRWCPKLQSRHEIYVEAGWYHDPGGWKDNVEEIVGMLIIEFKSVLQLARDPHYLHTAIDEGWADITKTLLGFSIQYPDISKPLLLDMAFGRGSDDGRLFQQSSKEIVELLIRDAMFRPFVTHRLLLRAVLLGWADTTSELLNMNIYQQGLFSVPTIFSNRRIFEHFLPLADLFSHVLPDWTLWMDNDSVLLFSAVGQSLLFPVPGVVRSHVEVVKVLLQDERIQVHARDPRIMELIGDDEDVLSELFKTGHT